MRIDSADNSLGNMSTRCLRARGKSRAWGDGKISIWPITIAAIDQIGNKKTRYVLRVMAWDDSYSLRTLWHTNINTFHSINSQNGHSSFDPPFFLNYLRCVWWLLWFYSSLRGYHKTWFSSSDMEFNLLYQKYRQIAQRLCSWCFGNIILGFSWLIWSIYKGLALYFKSKLYTLHRVLHFCHKRTTAIWSHFWGKQARLMQYITLLREP